VSEINHIPNLTWLYDADSHCFTMDVSYGFEYSGTPGSGIAWAVELVITPDFFEPEKWTMQVQYIEAPGYPTVDAAGLAGRWVKPANVKTDTDIRRLMEFGLDYARRYQHLADEQGYQAVVVTEDEAVS
jgi:hypothetical protein